MATTIEKTAQLTFLEERGEVWNSRRHFIFRAVIQLNWAITEEKTINDTPGFIGGMKKIPRALELNTLKEFIVLTEGLNSLSNVWGLATVELGGDHPR